MKLHLIIAILLLVGLFSGCKSQLKVLEANQHNWVGGAAGSGGGTAYLVKVEKPTGKPIQFSDAWQGDRTEGKMFKVTAQNSDSDRNTYPDNTVPTGKTDFLLEFRYSWRPERPDKPDSQIKNPETTKAPENLPDDFEKGTIVWYELDGKKSYFIIGDFTLKKDVYGQ